MGSDWVIFSSYFTSIFSYCWYGSVEGCVCFMQVLHLRGLCWEKYVICVHVEGYKNGERDVICKEDIANHDV